MKTQLYLSRGGYPTAYLNATADYIADLQAADGAIAWFENGVVDPWDHVEAAMGLSVAGRWREAHAAYSWLRQNQRDDGAWLAAYRDGEVLDGTRAETNFVAYIATGVWHHYLVTHDVVFLGQMWPTVRRAINFVRSLQSPHGEIYWALNTTEGVKHDALVTGCSSIYKSLECAINIASTLGKRTDAWLAARSRLGHALLSKPERFDRTWESKARYSMDWFYPVLAGIVRAGAARARLAQKWATFVVEGLGCRCVADEPWVTVAETCELTMALVGCGETHKAAELFSWLHDYRHSDGSWWTGYVYPDQAVWPEERPTWTAGAVLLAADALTQHTGAHGLFTGVNLPDLPQDAERLRHLALGE